MDNKDNNPNERNKMNNTTKFQIGKTYECTSICDSECIFKFLIIKRTAKTITTKWMGNIVRKTIKIRDGIESIRIENYSMAPIFFANRKAV